MRADVLAITAGEVHRTANEIRFLKPDELEEIPHRFLSASARMLRAGAYSAQVAARRLEVLAEQRDHAEKMRAAALRGDETTG